MYMYMYMYMYICTYMYKYISHTSAANIRVFASTVALLVW